MDFSNIFRSNQKECKWMDKVWRGFDSLYNKINRWTDHISRLECRELAMNWVTLTFRSSDEVRNNKAKWKFQMELLTPYIHGLTNHIPNYLPMLKKTSCQNLERSNNIDGRQFFQANSRRKNTRIREMMLRKYRIIMNPKTIEVDKLKGELECPHCMKQYMYELSLDKHIAICPDNYSSTDMQVHVTNVDSDSEADEKD
jgi:hypothetical protein